VRTVTVGLEVRHRSFAVNLTDVIECLSFFISIVLGALLVRLRPSRMTWAFFAFVLLSTSVSVTPLTLGNLGIDIAAVAYGALTILAWIPLTIFALRFPHDRPGKIARSIERVLLFSLIVLVPLELFFPITSIFATVSFALADTIQLLRRVSPPFGLVLAASMFAANYRAAGPSDRTRIRWVIAGFLGGYAAIVVRGFQSFIFHDFSARLRSGI